MPFTTLSQDDLEALYRAYLRSLLPDADVSPFSDADIEARVLAALYAGNQSQGDYVAKQIFPSTADDDFVIQHAAENGLARRSAIKSRGYVLITDANIADTQPAGAVFAHDDGTEYKLDANVVGVSGTAFSPAVTIAAGSTDSILFLSPDVSDITPLMALEIDGTAVCVVKDVIPSINAVTLFYPLAAAPSAADAVIQADAAVGTFTASEAGAAGNKPSGDLATLSSPVGDAEAAVVIVESTGGGDLETIEELRARVAAVIGTRPASGNPAQYREWAMSTPSVALADAFVFAGHRGYGTVDIVPFGVSGARVTGAYANSLIQAYIDERKPADDDVRVVQLSYDSAGAVDVELTVTLATGESADWEGTLTASLAYDAGTKGVSTTVSPTTILEVGDRVVFSGRIGATNYTEERTVTSVNALGFFFDTALSFPIEANDIIRPGSVASAGILTAIGALFDSVGPGTASGDARYPAESSAYVASIQPANIVQAAMSAAGVANVTVDSPSTTQVPKQLTALRVGAIQINYE